jgi:PAP2 superfamily protein
VVPKGWGEDVAIARKSIGAVAALFLVAAPAAAQVAGAAPTAESVLDTRYSLMLNLVRHTATYSPPVAARAFAYFGVIGYEAVASGRSDMKTLVGQLNGLSSLPKRESGVTYDEAVVLDAALSLASHRFFDNTGPTGQRAMKALDDKLSPTVLALAPNDVAERSAAYGRALTEAVSAWADGDGTGPVENMGFPLNYTLRPGPEHWKPTSNIAQQQVPLLPDWGKARTFAMPNGGTCDLPPPPEFSTDPSSQFYQEANEVCRTGDHLDAEQKAIARFWSDDPMLSTTPPGHWIQIAFQLFAKTDAPVEKRVDVLVRLGVVTADAFIACWNTKYHYDLVRPVTYINANINPKWQTLLITPPFPEYPSGHSSQSGAAAEVLTNLYGDDFAFDDGAHVSDGLPARHFASFWAAAKEAAMSRLYGGIHYRSAIEQGLVQGKCVGDYANALKTRVTP